VQRQAAAAGAAWLLSDCTDTCAYAPRCCLPALAELRKKNLLLLLLTATQLYTQRPTQEDAPHTHNKKEKKPKQTKYINENLFFFFFFFFVFVFVFFFCPPAAAAAAAAEETLNCTANNFQ
jgi:quinol-cytochrome oxidoreductase complex cytochrome b subunit